MLLCRQYMGKLKSYQLNTLIPYQRDREHGYNLAITMYIVFLFSLMIDRIVKQNYGVASSLLNIINFYTALFRYLK